MKGISLIFTFLCCCAVLPLFETGTKNGASKSIEGRLDFKAEDKTMSRTVGGIGKKRKSEEEKADPTTIAGLFEGDIEDVNAEDIAADSEWRNAIIDEHKKWPGKLIPYEIDSVYTEPDAKILTAAMDEFHSKTCIRFVPKTKEHEDYIAIRASEGCSSYVGKRGGEQQVSIGNRCLHHGIVVHELMHAVGFWHEQSREDRDDYVTILWDNIKPGKENNFLKYGWNSIQHLDESYDLDSIMHYKSDAFAKDKKNPTILPKDVSKLETMGQREGLSTVDVRKINKLYGCHSEAAKCVDKKKKCILFSKRKYCRRYKAYMKIWCQKSCGFCESQTNVV